MAHNEPEKNYTLQQTQPEKNQGLPSDSVKDCRWRSKASR